MIEMVVYVLIEKVGINEIMRGVFSSEKEVEKAIKKLDELGSYKGLYETKEVKLDKICNKLR